MATFLFYGLAPLAILLYLMGTPQRRRNRRAREASASREAIGHEPAGIDAESVPRQDQATSHRTGSGERAAARG